MLNSAFRTFVLAAHDRLARLEADLLDRLVDVVGNTVVTIVSWAFFPLGCGQVAMTSSG